MYLNPRENEITDTHEFVHNKQEAFQRAFHLVQRNLHEKQKRRNAIYSKKIHGLTYEERQGFCSIIQPSLWEQLLNSQDLGRDSMSLKNL